MKHLLLLIVLLPSILHSQISIGNLKLDSTIAAKYLIDCYNHPDTIKEKRIVGYTSEWHGDAVLEARRKADIDNAELKKSAIKIYNDTIRYNAFIDTTYNEWLDPVGKKQNGKIVHKVKLTIKEIKHYPAGQYPDVYYTFIVPRKPSEADFIKWYKNNQ